jgi:hypothetical protein
MKVSEKNNMSTEFDLLYVYLNASSSENSIQRKIVAQISMLNQCGIKAKGLFLTTDVGVRDIEKSPQVEWLIIEDKRFRFFVSIREKSLILKHLRRYLKANKSKYRYFYLRNIRPSFGWLRVLRLIYPKSIVEHQTIEIAELNNLRRDNKFGLRPSNLLSWIEYNFIPYVSEIFLGSMAISSTGTVVGVTDEISKYEVKRAFFQKPNSVTIPNGIIVDDYDLRKAPDFDGKELHLLMLVGGSNQVDWHGLDLIIAGIKKYKGKTNIYLHLAGRYDLLSDYNEDFIIKHGYCTKNTIDKLSNICHLGLGSFALQRKVLTEASTLKMREYGARGIPVVYGHIDNDFEDLVINSLSFKLDPMVVPCMNLIVDFAYKVCNQEASRSIREYTKLNMDMTIKMNKLKEALNIIS